MGKEGVSAHAYTAQKKKIIVNCNGNGHKSVYR